MRRIACAPLVLSSFSLFAIGCSSSGEVPDYGTGSGTQTATSLTTGGPTTSGVTSTATTGLPVTSSATSSVSGFTATGTTTATATSFGSITGTSTTTATATATSTTGSVTLANFSFFVTSLAGLQELSGNPQGFGGNLTYGGAVGLAGADLICQTLAERSMPGSGVKGWRAFLSTTAGDAIDRIGQGPWYDREGRLVADDLDGLLEDRPDGDASITEDLPNENGYPNSTPVPGGDTYDNHDTMTASDSEGRLVVGSDGGGGGGDDAFGTCMDFTSAEPGLDPPVMGHSWSAQSGTNWIEVGRHGNGCEPLVHLEQTGGSNGCGSTGVGCGGGYGGFYCFALTP